MAFECVPAEVGAAGGRQRQEVDLLVAGLAHVGDHQPVAPGAGVVDREAEGVAEAEREDLVAAAAADERVGARHRVGGAPAPPAGHDAEELAVEREPALGRVAGVAKAPAVAGRQVEDAAAEEKLAPVVAAIELAREREHLAAAGAHGDSGVAAGAAQLLEPDVPPLVRVVDVEEAAAPVVRWEGEGEQAALVADATDRKSTRLNSSHGYISYAVFCLKK